MILYKNRLIFGIIKKIIVIIFTVIYKILALFNLQLTLLMGLLGLVLFFTGVFENNPALLIIYYVLIIISIVYAILATIKKLLGLDKKVKKSKGAQIVSTEKAEEQEKIVEQKVDPTIMSKVETPTYFRVKNQPDYIMAEYGNRYELFKKTENGLKKIRTDYK